MTRSDALGEAQRRWGDRAVVDDLWVFRVGVHAGGHFVTRGVGTTWELAFNDADRFVEWRSVTTPYRYSAWREALLLEKQRTHSMHRP